MVCECGHLGTPSAGADLDRVPPYLKGLETAIFTWARRGSNCPNVFQNNTVRFVIVIRVCASVGCVGGKVFRICR